MKPSGAVVRLRAVRPDEKFFGLLAERSRWTAEEDIREGNEVKGARNRQWPFRAYKGRGLDRDNGGLNRARGLGPFAGAALIGFDWRRRVTLGCSPGDIKGAQEAEVVGMRQDRAGAQPETHQREKERDTPLDEL